MKKLLLISILLIVLSTTTSAQHNMEGMDMHNHKSKETKATGKASTKKVTQKKVTKPAAKKPSGNHTHSTHASPTTNQHHISGTQQNKGLEKGDTTHSNHMNHMESGDMHGGNVIKDSMKMDHMGSMQQLNMNGSSDVSKDSMKMDPMGNMHHDMDGMSNRDTTKKSGMNDMNMDHSNMNSDHSMSANTHHMNMDMNGMSHSYSLNLSMSRNGSGTAWLPDASPMYGYMFHKNKWMYMLHGNLFLRYNNQDFTNRGSRGASKFDAPDWVMLMAQRQVGKTGLFHFSSMLSLDAVIAGGSGYPLLFQSGEAYKGKAIVDRQHPHDLFSELSVGYSQALSKKADVFAYVGYPGEPAIGPVAFMHRPSALDNPDAPISHHWVDATHIIFGVATLGVRYGNFKVEGSSFTGREPNENRFNFDKPLFNSYSGRLSYNPSKNWALQVSQGFIKSPELLHSEEDINRSSASVIYSTEFKNNSTFNATALWGKNKSEGHKGENAVLVEGSWRMNKLALHTRYEWVEKSTEELSLDETAYGHHILFPVNAFTAGFNYDLLKFGNTRLAGGGQLTFYHADQRLNTLYGKNPMAVEVYLRLYPGRMGMKM